MATPQRQSEVLKIKAAVRTRDGNACTKCGMTAVEHRERFGRTLDVHRTTPRSRYVAEECVTVCRPCHGPEPRSARGKVDQSQPGKVIAQISRELRDALNRYTHDHKASVTSTIEAALKKYLEAEGHWPPKNPGPRGQG